MMSNFGESMGQGQKEIIRRGERTDPRMIVNQAKWFAFCLTFLVGLVEFFYLWYIDARWYEIRHWLWELSLPIAIPFAVAAVLAAIALFIEIFDPNYPNPRKATSSTRPNMPWSKERGITERQLRKSKIDPDALRELLALLQEEEDE